MEVNVDRQVYLWVLLFEHFEISNPLRQIKIKFSYALVSYDKLLVIHVFRLLRNLKRIQLACPGEGVGSRQDKASASGELNN